ncbi:hypothetical protein C7M84_015122 [Penaeus vannamei]|uniref:Uncharacterized protein n=1 Tax=Penaeus vannamei TaxID=6689 RepID=A0A423SRG5_PENVA|nr:hypothetical protein C7M84_015122 [Penaeus vannamei]
MNSLPWWSLAIAAPEFRPRRRRQAVLSRRGVKLGSQTMSRSTMPTTSSEHSTPTSAKVKRNPSSVSRKSNGDSYNLSNGKTSPLKPKSKPCCSQYHLNSVWSIWYCLVSLGFMAYLVYNGVKRFLLYASLPWPQDPPFVELNAYVGLVGASVVLLPFFLVTSLLKVGNLGNDGFKLGASLSTCSRDPPPVLEAAKGVVRNLWLHGVPTAPFLHLVAAFCLLLPRTLMDATLISAGFLPKGPITAHPPLTLLPPPPLPLSRSSNPCPLPTLPFKPSTPPPSPLCVFGERAIFLNDGDASHPPPLPPPISPYPPSPLPPPLPPLLFPFLIVNFRTKENGDERRVLPLSRCLEEIREPFKFSIAPWDRA